MRAGVKPAVVVQDLHKEFTQKGDNVVALTDVNLSIPEGEFASIVGPSGCGKSTLLYILGGFVKPSSGKAYSEGKLITGPGVDRGIVFQEYALFPWLTVYDNIAYGLRRKGVDEARIRQTVERYISLIHLAGFEQRYPRELSGGMRQRVALARTFAYEPDILLLDEPFGALDAQTREFMQDELLRLWESSGKTVIMVTHDIGEAVYLSNKIYVMSRRPGTMVREFNVDMDRKQGREAVTLSDAYAHLRNEVWLAVREQVLRSGQEQSA